MDSVVVDIPVKYNGLLTSLRTGENEKETKHVDLQKFLGSFGISLEDFSKQITYQNEYISDLKKENYTISSSF